MYVFSTLHFLGLSSDNSVTSIKVLANVEQKKRACIFFKNQNLLNLLYMNHFGVKIDSPTIFIPVHKYFFGNPIVYMEFLTVDFVKNFYVNFLLELTKRF